MIPNLTIIISVYCIIRLLWHIEDARVGSAGKPSILYSILSGIGIVVIAWLCLETFMAGAGLGESTRPTPRFDLDY